MQSKPLLLGAVRWTLWPTDCLADYGSEASRPVSQNREIILFAGNFCPVPALGWYNYYT